jgi:hypothetical protein
MTGPPAQPAVLRTVAWTRLFGLWLGFAGILAAQITGHIAGTITDASGGAVPAAKVALTNQQSGERRTQTADDAGRFAFNRLKIGTYTLQAEAGGFRQETTTVPVRSGETSTVVLQLEVGIVSDSVEVTGAVSPLDQTDAQIQLSIGAHQTAVLPVGRNPILLALISPGVSPVTANNPNLNSGNFNTNGGRGRANNITIDNITATDIVTTGNGGNQIGPLNFAEIQEVKLITNNFSAEYGRNSSSQLQFLTKSGSNQFHGEAWEFLKNDILNARDFFDRSGSATVTRRNQFGYALGGPIVRNKTQFFTSFEDTQLRGLGTVRVAQVATPAMAAQITDPTSKKLWDQYQVPTADSGQITQSSPNLTRAFQFSFRVDHQLSSNDNLYARYGHYQQENSSTSLTFNSTNLTNFGASSTNGPRNFSLGETHIFSPTVVNEFRFGFGRSSPYFLPSSTVPLGPQISFSNGQVSSFGQSASFPQGRIQNTFEYNDTLSVFRGGHNIKFGADVSRYQLNSSADAATRGLITFASWDDFAAGRPLRYQQLFGSTVRGNRITNQFYFVQDDWRIRPNLTINLGLRAEVAGGVSEVNGLISNLDITCHDPIGAAGTGPLGCFTTGQPSNHPNVNWAPRVGFAWSPFANRRTVVRGGYGMAYDFLFLNPIINQRQLPPYIQVLSLTSFGEGNSYANLVAGSAPVQAAALASIGSFNSTARNFGAVSPAIDPNLRNPQVQQWSLGVEREIARDLVLKLSYVGTKGTYLQRMHPINLIQDPRVVPAASVADETARIADYQAAYLAGTGSANTPSNRYDPRFNDVNLLESSANSIYHSLQFLAEKSFHHGYSLQVAYTYSKSIDDVSDALGVLINDSSGQQNPRDNRDNRAVSQFDLSQRLVIAHVWELPWGRHLEPTWLRYLASGWSFAGISTFRSGFPVTFDSGARRTIQALTLTGVTGGPVRLNAAGPVNFDPQPAGSAGAPNGLNNDPVQRISAYAESLGLSQPLLGNYGSLGRNASRLNSDTNFDWNFYKNTPLREGLMLQLRGEIYNIFNNTSFQDVTRIITSSTFGQYSTVTHDSRNIQLGIRLIF